MCGAMHGIGRKSISQVKENNILKTPNKEKLSPCQGALFGSKSKGVDNTMKRIFYHAALLLAVSFLSNACSTEGRDGDWNSMEWKTTVLFDRNDEVRIPRGGGVYRMECTNYAQFWIYALIENDVLYRDGYPDALNSPVHITGKWSEAYIEKNAVTVKIAPNESGKQRRLELGLEVGDTFSRFKFIQR